MKSFFAVALCLSLVFTFANARIPHSYRQLQERDDETETPNRFLSWIKGIFKRQDSSQESSQNDVCYVDEYYTFVNGTDGNAFGKNVCQDLGIIYPNRTVTEDFTPTSTVTAVNTQIFTQDGLVRTTPVTIITVTVTPSGVQKRDAQVTPMAHDVRDLRNDYINLFRRQADNDTVLPEDDETIAASLSSACLCQTYIGTTITETYTNQPNYATLKGVVRTTTTVFSTRVDREITSTVTVTAPFETAAEPSESDSEDDESTAESSAAASATNSPQTSAASGGSMVVETTGVSQGTPSIEEPTSTETSVSPDPTAPPFTCPDDDGMVISQMLGSERFDYGVFCDKDLPTSPELSSVLDLTYDTFSECVASCSYANAQFDQPLCQGAAYFETASSSRNCILKSSANAMDSVSATGVNIAILKSIAIGFDDAHPEGTNTEVVSFSSETPTMDPEEMGSSIMSMMGSSASTMPMVTPPAVYSGRPVMNGVTAYSTYVSDGSTFSTGSVFSTYVSGNGSWYSAYYSTFSVAWTNVQTIFAAGETTYPVAYNNTGVTKESNGDGGYTLWKNITTSTASYQDNQTVFDVTEIIEADYIAPNGTQTSSSVTTNFYSYTQAAVGGANGGAANSDAGVVTSSYSTQTVIYSSGFAAGGTGLQASGIVQTPAPVITSTISTQSVIASSGGLNGGEGNSANGAAGSIVPTTITSTSVFSTQAVISSSGGLNGASSGEGSGAAGSTVPIIGGSSIVINTYGTAGSTGLVLSGVVSINGISGATSLVASGAVPSTGSITSTFIDTTVVSSIGGTQGALSTAASGAGSDSGTSGVTSTAASGEASPSTGTRTSSQALRTGIDSDSFSSAATYSGTSYLVPYPPIVTPLSGSVPAVNSSLPLPTGTGSAPFSQPSGPRVGTDSSSTPFGTGPVPYPPIETLPPTNETLSFPTSGLPASSSTPLGTGPVSYPGFSTSPPANATVPAPTGTPSGSFTNSRNPREGTDSSSTIPGTGLVPYPPLSTGPPSNVTTAVPTGTLPGSFTNTPNPREGTDSSSTLPGTGPVPYPPFTTGPPSKSTAPVPTGTSPSNMTLPAPSGSVFGSFSNSQTLRVGTDSESTTSRRRPFAAIQSLPPPVRATSTQASVSLSTGVVGNATESSSIPLSTGPPSNGTTPTLSFPTTSVPTSCPSQSIGTTTMWMTTTLLGCFSQCPPSGNGGYGGYGGGHDGYGNGPQSFGPPAAIFAPTLVGNPTPESTSPAETSSA